MSTLKRLLRRKAVVIPFAVVVLAAAGGGAWAATRGGSSPSGATVTEQLYTVAATTLKQTVSETGTIEAKDTEELSFPAGGKITSVSVTEGQQVKKGQKLATIDSASLRVAAAQATVSLENAKARLASDQASGASSAVLTADQASIDAASSAVESANANLDEATMTSPIDGQVTEVNIATGDNVGSSSSGGGANSPTGSNSSSSSSTAQIKVVSSSFVVNVDVDTTVVDQIRKGVQATITPTGSSTPIYGTVTSIGLVASTSSGVATFPVVIDVTGTPEDTYAGTSATVEILYRQLTDVLAVPVAAIERDANGGTTVTVVRNGARSTQAVTTGDTINGQTEIKSGLAEGDQVAYKVTTIRRNGTGTTGGTGNNRGNNGGGFQFNGGGGGNFPAPPTGGNFSFPGGGSVVIR